MQKTLTDAPAYLRLVEANMANFDRVAAWTHEIADRVLDRLPLMKFTPESIAIIGSSDGYLIKRLREAYPQSRLIAIELTSQWQQQYPKAYALCDAFHVVDDYANLPLDDQSVDAVVCHLAPSWSPDFKQLALTWRRVIAEEGILLFSCLGVDTLKECREAWTSVGETHRTHEFTDMHWVGDTLLTHRWVDPVVHMETLTIHYKTLDHLWRDLRFAMATNVRQDRPKGLLSPRRWQAMCHHYTTHFKYDNHYPLTLEVVYGHALSPGQVIEQTMNAQGQVEVPLSALLSTTKKEDTDDNPTV